VKIQFLETKKAARPKDERLFVRSSHGPGRLRETVEFDKTTVTAPNAMHGACRRASRRDRCGIGSFSFLYQRVSSGHRRLTDVWGLTAGASEERAQRRDFISNLAGKKAERADALAQSVASRAMQYDAPDCRLIGLRALCNQARYDSC